MTCMGVHLGNIDMTGAADGDGIVWSWRRIDGWWEGGTPSLPFDGKPGNDGSNWGAGFRRGRPITLGGVASVPPSTPEATAVSRLLLARRKVNEAADLIRASGTFTVDEEISRFATVRRNLAPTFVPQESPYALDFTVPLVAADWRKYTSGAVATTGAVATPAVAVNAGDAPTPPTVTISGAAADNLYVEKQSTTETIYTNLTGLTGGDVVVIDFAAMTMTKNGFNSVLNLDVESDFFDLSPGSNTIILGNPGTATIKVDWRAAWL